MQLKIEGAKEHKGFILKETANMCGNILVVSGRNGSGKTRLIESISNSSSVASIDGETIDIKDIQSVPQNSLTPNIGANYNEEQFQKKVTASLRFYDMIKNDLKSPFTPDKVAIYNRSRNGGLDYESLFNLCLSISKILDKPPYELSHDEIILHFEEPLGNILGMQNISIICNQYIKRLHNNQYNEWLKKEKGMSVVYWTEDEFLDRFGEKPWVRVNRILNDTFDGKFKLSIPDEASHSYNYRAQLMQRDNDLSVLVEHLSSGEKTLLWLALTLFNSQYYNAELTRTPKLLLIDEPDAFLHPKMVLKMYRTFESFNRNFNSIVLISTHSPTTIALAPTNNIYLVDNNTISTVDKDAAIAELLDGITQISLDPKNRRQVYVESQYDADVYQAIFAKLVQVSKILDPKISIYFVSSGPKMPKQLIVDKAKQILGLTDESIINEYVEALNGVGNCSQVIGQVESLVKNDNPYVRGIIDWDLKNTPSSGVSVLAKDYAYSIENITLDPVCILLLLHITKPESFTMMQVCGSDVNWNEWLNNSDLLQVSVDTFISNILGKDNAKDSKLNYVSGLELLTDKEYLMMNGHDLEKLVKIKYPQLKEFCKKGKDGELKKYIVNRSMTNLTNGKFIPRVFEELLFEVQN